MNTLDELSLPSPAKINRFLHIVGRRSDGYHLLQTLFQFLDVGDQLIFTPRADGKIILEPEDVVGIPLQENLIYRAAMMLKEAAGTKQGATITIEKNLPLGAGLGGGSSNAATTLLGLNWLWGLHWSREQLMPLGLRLGADVPIFLHGHAAWAEGIGEQLTTAKLEEPWVAVVIPPCHVSTPKMYAADDLTRDTPTFKIVTLATGELELALNEFKNDFEPVVRQHYPEVDAAMKWLSNFGKARLSGSGASVFACFSSWNEAKEVLKHLPPRFKGFIARGVNKSPLWLAAEHLGLHSQRK